MKNGCIHHIELYVSDLHKSLKFWSWFLSELGYQKYQYWDKGQSWKLEDTYIVFVQTEEKYLDIKYHRKRVGLNHIAFAVTPEQLASLQKKLVEKGIIILYEDQRFTDKLFFEDPDKIKVELACY